MKTQAFKHSNMLGFFYLCLHHGVEVRNVKGIKALMRFKEIEGLRPLTEFEGSVTKKCLIVL